MAPSGYGTGLPFGIVHAGEAKTIGKPDSYLGRIVWLETIIFNITLCRSSRLLLLAAISLPLALSIFRRVSLESPV